MTPYDKMRWEAEQLGEGVHRIVCPFCLGGSSGEKSLSLGVAADGSMFFRCFRANCAKSGGKTPRGPKHSKPPRYYTGETVSLDDDRKLWFQERFGFVPGDTRYSPFSDRYVYAVRGPRDFVLRGHVARSFNGEEPKVLTYNERPDEPFVGWSCSPHYSAATGPIVVVEDWVSAEKIGVAGGVGVALNGTYMSQAAANEIAECALDRRVVFALDRDAFAKCVRLAADYGGLFKRRPRVWRLREDLKYEPIDVIVRAMGDDDYNDFGDEWARAADRPRLH